MNALDAYHEGDVEPIIACLLDALEIAVVIGVGMASAIDEVINSWHEVILERRGSAIFRLPGVLVEQPVVNAELVSKQLGITERAARSLIDRACEYGILTKMGNARRGVFYQASDLLDVLEEVVSKEGIRRSAL